jgi:2-dehydropantoate 2-reductase
MKIAIVGCGAVGSYYGAMLCRAGQNVHFLLRSDYEAVKRAGVLIRNDDDEFRIYPNCAKSSEEFGESDIVFIALKTTANYQFSKLLPPLVGKHTAIVTLQNGLGNEEALAKLFPAEQILGGLCFVCLNRTAPAVVEHKAHGQIVLGEFQRAPQQRTHDIAALFNRAGVPCKVTDNLARAHWEKLIWNVPFNGLGVAGIVGYDAVMNPTLSAASMEPGEFKSPVLTTDVLLRDIRWENLVRELMHEVIATANALGLGVSEMLAEKQIVRTREMGAYKASTLIDFERGQPLELESLFLEPLRQAQKADVPTPRLARLCEVLKKLNPY